MRLIADYRQWFIAAIHNRRTFIQCTPAFLVERLEDRRLLSATLADLSVAAQQTISTAIGQDQSIYYAATGAAGIRLANPANGFTVRVQAGTLLVAAGADTWNMTLQEIGYGGALQPVGTVQTTANINRVDNNYGAVDEWYVNGPNGLEQGFTVAALPQTDTTGALTVQLALSGDLTATVHDAGDGLTLSGPNGTAVLAYTGLAAYDATGKVLPASLQVVADGGHQDLLIQVDDAGAQGAITIDPFVQRAKLTASDGKDGDNFGNTVAIDGNTVVVGAPNATIGNNTNQGAAYVFTESGSDWGNMTQTAKLTVNGGRYSDYFGDSVAISGNTIVVGAYDTDAGNGYDEGAAYVFTAPATGWAGNLTQTAKLISSDGPSVVQDFGWSVAISGNTVVVGADESTIGNNASQGAAYVFTEPATGWANMGQTARLTDTNPTAVDDFGIAVAISGNTVVVGATQGLEDGTNLTGAAYVYTEPGTGWANVTQNAELTASDGADGDYFGSAVAISGGTIVVGAPYATVHGNASRGAAYVFAEPDSGWAGNLTQTGKLSATDGAAGDYFGYAVAVSGNTAVVGADSADVGSKTFQGAAYVFTEPGSGWGNMTQTSKLTASDGKADDFFGYAVAISSTTAVVGAPVTGGGGPGSAYVYPVPTISVSAPFNAIVTAGQSQTFQLGNFTQSNAAGPFSVDVNWGDGSTDSVISQAAAGLIPATTHTFTTTGNLAVTITVTDAGKDAVGNATFIANVASMTVTPPGNQTSTAGQSYSFALGSFTQANAGSPYTVEVNWGDDSPDSIFSVAAAGAIPATAHIYANIGNDTASIIISELYGRYSNTATFGVRVTTTPVFSNLSASSNIPVGTAAETFSGTIAAGAMIPPSTETVAITLNGVTQNAAINAQGNFSSSFNTSTLPAAYTPYQVTYAYAGDTLLTSITDNTTTTLTVSGVEEQVYRLYSPVTLEHLYTTDLNEYDTLKQYVGTWNAEGQVFSIYSGPATVDGVADEPLYRLYDAPLKQHFWTDDYNEYNTLRNAPWNWNDEGIVGYVFPTAVAASEPLYRMMAPQVHLWTTDVNEYDVLTSDGWTQEGIIGYVM